MAAQWIVEVLPRTALVGGGDSATNSVIVGHSTLEEAKTTYRKMFEKHGTPFTGFRYSDYGRPTDYEASLGDRHIQLYRGKVD